jgi:hypothetical protein
MKGGEQNKKGGGPTHIIVSYERTYKQHDRYVLFYLQINAFRIDLEKKVSMLFFWNRFISTSVSCCVLYKTLFHPIWKRIFHPLVTKLENPTVCCYYHDNNNYDRQTQFATVASLLACATASKVGVPILDLEGV